MVTASLFTSFQKYAYDKYVAYDNRVKTIKL